MYVGHEDLENIGRNSMLFFLYFSLPIILGITASFLIFKIFFINKNHVPFFDDVIDLTVD